MGAGLQLLQIESVQVFFVKHAGDDIVAQLFAGPLRFAEQGVFWSRCQFVPHRRHTEGTGQKKMWFAVDWPGGVFVVAVRQRVAEEDFPGFAIAANEGVLQISDGELAAAVVDGQMPRKTSGKRVWMGIKCRGLAASMS